MHHLLACIIKLVISMILFNNKIFSDGYFFVEYKDTGDTSKYLPARERGFLRVVDFYWKGTIPDTEKYIHVDYKTKEVISREGKEKDSWNFNLDIEKSEKIYALFDAKPIDNMEIANTYILTNAFRTLNFKGIVLGPWPAADQEYLQVLCRSDNELRQNDNERESGKPTHTIPLLSYEKIPHECLWSGSKNDEGHWHQFHSLRTFSLRLESQQGLLKETRSMEVYGARGKEYIVVDCHKFSQLTSKISPLFYQLPWTIRHFKVNQKKLSLYFSSNLWEINFKYHSLGNDNLNANDDQRRGVWQSNKLPVQEKSDECLYTLTNANEWKWKRSTASKVKHRAAENSMLLCSKQIKNGKVEYYVRQIIEKEDVCCKWNKKVQKLVYPTLAQYQRTNDCKNKGK